MTRRKLRRKLRLRWPQFLRGYKHRRRLHEHEELVVLKLLVERGGTAMPLAWDRDDPGRWDAVLLRKVFHRLRDKRYVKFAGTRAIWGGWAGSSYEITELGRARVREETRHGAGRDHRAA